MNELFLGNLALSFEGPEACSPSRGSGRYVVIPCNFNGFDSIAALVNANDFIEMAWIVPDPFTG
jgi:hypothetical protein